VSDGVRRTASAGDGSVVGSFGVRVAKECSLTMGSLFRYWHRSERTYVKVDVSQYKASTTAYEDSVDCPTE
jgi:hypothetical protein